MILLWDSFGIDKDSQQVKTKVAFILYSYPQLFSSTILVDPLFGSAVVHLPHPLTVDLRLICGEAGYIHSCGEAIYVRKIGKSQKSTLADNVETYINRAYPKRLTFFSTYSHEQFTEHEDPHIEPEYRHGLHEVKIDLAKFHLENTPLFDVLGELKNRLTDQLYIPPGVRRYKDERAHFKTYYGERANKEATLWLLMDRSLPERDSGAFQYPGNDRYFVCYAQQYANRNPFISFNERKPAWIAPTTLPHTLAAAMINLARPYLPYHKLDGALKKPEQQSTCIIDPFSGTGTTFLEALKLGLHTHFLASDTHPVSGLLLKDNLHFFSLSQEELDRNRQEILDLLAEVKSGDDTSAFKYRRGALRRSPPLQTTMMRERIIWAIEAFASECPDVLDGNMRTWRQLYSYSFSEDFIKCFDAGEDYFWSRVVFYLVWRAVLTNLYNIGAGVVEIGRAIEKELEIFCGDLVTLAKMRPRSAPDAVIANIGIYEWVYCSACMIPNTLLREEASKLEIGHIISGNDADVLKVLEDAKETVDLILTDPPYGFNTDYKNSTELGTLYIHALRKMLRALKKDGQLVFCLPAESFNGQSVPYFSTKRMVVRDLLCAAEAEDRQIRYPGGALPDPVALYKPPYYWRSEKALTRTILHFRLE